MKHILRQSLYLCLSVAALYGLLLVLSLWWFPPGSSTAPLDTSESGRSLYMTEPKYIFFKRPQLNTSTDKWLLLGASNVGVGLKPSQLQALVPHTEIHNLAVGGSNATQLRQVLELVREVQTPDARRHNTVVIGLWYGLFADDAVRWRGDDRHAGDTDIDIERYRYGLYRRTESGPSAVLPPAHQGLGALWVHPYLVADRTLRDLTKGLRGKLAAPKADWTDEARNAAVLSAEDKRQHLQFWHRYMGEQAALPQAQFDQIEALVNTVVRDGGRVLLVQLPIPDWHAQGAGLQHDYQQRLATLLPRLSALPEVRVVDLTDASTESDFSDEVHPKPRVTAQWASRVASAWTAAAHRPGVQSASPVPSHYQQERP